MWFYSFRLPRKLLTLVFLASFITIITLIKSSLVSMPVIGEAEPIYQGDKGKNTIAFTCNVAWGNEHIPALLSIFEEKDVQITFFIEGRWAEGYPEILKLIASKGHEIGNHGYSYGHHAGLSLEENINEIKDGETAIAKVTKIKTDLFAPPYGEFSDLTSEACKIMEYKLIMWSIDSQDLKKPGPNYIVDKILEKAGNGKIVLLHPTEDTVRALPTVIENLRHRGFEIGCVSQVL